MGIMVEHTKPMLTTEELIMHLKSKAVKFELCSEEDAYYYLRNNNNYFKLSSYRKNYEKYSGGVNDGKYIDLDFGHLRDLAVIDMKLRYTVVQLALNIEHYAKLEILRKIEDEGEDGYSICEDFINGLPEKQQSITRKEIGRNKRTVYCGDLFNKYPEKIPVWVFMEMISFGRLVSFYGFCAERFSSKKMMDNHFLLKTCKEIRNAAAHSSCILNELKSGSIQHRTNNNVSRAVSSIKEISKACRKSRMSNARIQQIVTLLYTHKIIVTSKGVDKMSMELLGEFKKRMNKNIGIYDGNELIRNSFKFLEKIIDNWF